MTGHIARKLDKTLAKYEDILLLPVGEEKDTRQLAVFLGCYIGKVKDAMPMEDLKTLSKFKVDLFTLLNEHNKKTSFTVLTKKGRVKVPKEMFKYFKTFLIPIADEKNLDELLSIFDHILWNNTQHLNHPFVVLLENQVRLISKLLDILSGRHNYLIFWEEIP